MMTHPAVGQVAVIGVPDARLGEVGRPTSCRAGATVDEAELLAWCREAMANYKAPRSVAVVDASAERHGQGPANTCCETRPPPGPDPRHAVRRRPAASAGPTRVATRVVEIQRCILAVSLRRGNGWVGGRGTPRNPHSGPHPSATSNTSRRQGGARP